MMLFKVLEKNIWGGLTTLVWLVLLIGFVVLGLVASGTLSWQALSHGTKVQYYAYSYALLITLLPFLIVIYPFAVNQKLVVRGFWNYLYYPLTFLVALIFLLVYFALIEWTDVRLHLAAKLAMTTSFDFHTLIFPTFQFHLTLPNTDGISKLYQFDFVSQLVQSSLVWHKKITWHALSPNYFLSAIFALHLTLVTLIKRNMSQNERFQNLFSWSFGNTGVIAFTFWLLRIN